ncbi:MAG: hypothetical protein UHD09_03770 [Bifidobacterium sp.]|nr:hypothetical protein [Bifidobacterium sp.]
MALLASLVLALPSLAACSTSLARTTAEGGDRWASSVREYAQMVLDAYEQQETEGGKTLLSDFPRSLMERAAAGEKITPAEYERSWSAYRQCVADRGYVPPPAYKIGGVYRSDRTEDSSEGTEAQWKRLEEATDECSMLHIGGVQGVYLNQQGNQSLYQDVAMAATDCLRRANAVEISYTADRFREERARFDKFLEWRGTSNPPSVAESNEYFSFDLRDPSVAECLACSGSSLPNDTGAYVIPEWHPFG